MSAQLFPYANIITGILVFIIGFIIHWVAQLLSVVNWDFATKIGIQEKKLLPEYKVYEHAIAVADVMIGWIYGIAAVGLIFNVSLAYRLAWIPGAIMIYHGFSFWFWSGNQIRAGHRLHASAFRIGWFLANLITGVLTILVAWRAY